MDTSNANEGSDSQNISANGAALLLVIGEPFSEEHKILILEEVTKGFRSWDVEATGIDINDELAQIANKADLGEEGPNGERIIRHNSEKLAAEILVNPQTQTLTLAVKNFLSTPTKHKQLIYAGHSFQGSGAWILQDDTYTFNNFAHAFKDQDVANALLQQKGSSLYLYTQSGGDWSDGHISKNDFSKILKVSLNPSDKLDTIHGVLQFTAYVGNFVRVRELSELMQSTDVVGNIRFSRPTLYIFPACQGDSALFGIMGFNLLVNGGFSRKACFWDLTRHLDRIDAALMTHLGTDNLYGLGSVLKRKSIENVHPEIGYMYINASDKLKELTVGEKTEDKGLSVNLAEEGNKLIQYAKQIGQVPHPCTRSQGGQTVEPVNLYHKVGIGSLDMYILNPITDSKELKDFYQQWNQKVAQFGTNQHVPLPNTLSICALLVWRPSDPNDNITRIFFPGNAPQHKVIEGLEKLKTLNILKHAKCTSASLQAKPATKKPGGLSAKPPARAKASPVTTPKTEIPKKEATPVKTAPRPKPATSAPKAKKEDVNKKTSKASEKIKDEKTDKTKSSTSSSPSKGSMKSSTASTPKEVETPTKEPEVLVQPSITTQNATETETEPSINGIGSSVDPPVGFSSEPLEPSPAQDSEPEPRVMESPVPVPEPEPTVEAPADEPEVMDKNKMLELGIYDDEHDIEEALNTQQNQQHETDRRMPQMFGGMTDSMHEDLIGDIGSGKGMQGSFHGDLMTGSMHEIMFDNNKPFEDQGFVENGCTPVEEVTTPEDDTSEEIQPQALPEPQAYAPASYGQEPDVIPNMPVKDEPADFVQHEAPSPVEPDLLQVKQDSPDEISNSQEIGEQSTAPVEPVVEKIEDVKQESVPVELETPDEVENTLPIDEAKADIEEKDVTEDTEKDSAIQQDDVNKPLDEIDIKLVEPEDKSCVDLRPREFFTEPERETEEKLEQAEIEDFKDKAKEEEPMPEPIQQDDGDMPLDELEIKLVEPKDESCIDLRPRDFITEHETAVEEKVEQVETENFIDKAKEEEPVETENFIDKAKEEEPVPEGQLVETNANDTEDLTDLHDKESPEGLLEPEIQSLEKSESQEIEDIYERPKSPEPEELDDALITAEPKGPVSELVSNEPGEIADYIEDSKTHLEEQQDSEPVVDTAQYAPVLDDEEEEIVENIPPSQNADMIENDYVEGEENIVPTEQAKAEEVVEAQECREELRPETPESQEERADSPDSQAEAEHLQRDSLERDFFKESSPAVESDEQRDSIEKESEPQTKESSPEEDQRDSIEQSFEDEETEESDEEEDDEQESSSFEQEEATDEKCLIQDSASEEKRDDMKGHETDSLATPYDFLGDQPSDNLLTPGSETMLTPESETTDASHGGQLGYHQIDDQDQDSVEGVDTKEAYAYAPQSTNPFRQDFEEVDGQSPPGPMANPFDDMVDQPSGLNPFPGFGQQPVPQHQGNFEDNSSDDEYRTSGGPAGFNPLAEWGEPMGLPSPPPPEEKNVATAKKPSPRPKSASKLGDKKPNGDNKAPEAKKPASSATKKLGLSRPAPKPSNGVPDRSKARPATDALNTSKSATSTANSSRLSLGGKTATASKLRPASAPAKDKPAPKAAEAKPKANGTKRPATATGSRASPASVKMPPLPAFNPYYVDLTYIPNHGNPDYSDIEFFKRVRARYYVLSALSPNTQILDALLDAKKTWEDKDLAVTIIPTYDNETLRLWMSLHKEKLADAKVEIAPSASRCMIQLQDHETSSSAYRLEF